MTRLWRAVVLCLVLAAACTAGGKSDDGLIPPASARDGGYDAAADHRDEWRIPGDGCDPNVPYLVGACSPDDYAPYVACMNDACGESFAACAEPCSRYTSCIERCSCEDRRCVEACVTSAPCQDCQLAHPCSPDCDAELPACSFRPHHSCEDLDACCAAADSDTLRSACETALPLVSDTSIPDELCTTLFENLGCIDR